MKVCSVYTVQPYSVQYEKAEEKKNTWHLLAMDLLSSMKLLLLLSVDKP